MNGGPPPAGLTPRDAAPEGCRGCGSLAVWDSRAGCLPRWHAVCPGRAQGAGEVLPEEGLQLGGCIAGRRGLLPSGPTLRRAPRLRSGWRGASLCLRAGPHTTLLPLLLAILTLALLPRWRWGRCPRPWRLEPALAVLVTDELGAQPSGDGVTAVLKMCDAAGIKLWSSLGLS